MADTPNQLIVIGGGEHARVIIDAARTSGWEVLGFLDPQPCDETCRRYDLPRLGTDDDVPSLAAKQPQARFIIGIGAVGQRRRRLVERFGLPPERWATVIHQTAVVSDTTAVECGVLIGARAILQTGCRVGEHAIVNTGAILEHDLRLGAFSHLGPGVVTGGGCTIGNDCLIGTAARLRDHVQIGDGVTVGTGSVVVSDVPSGLTVAGVPALPLERKQGREHLDDVCIPADATIHDAMHTMARSGAMICLVTDHDRKLLGTVTDGNIRRALLEHHEMDEPITPFMNPDFIAIREAMSRARALDLMKAHSIAQLPVLDEQGRVIGLHLMSSLIGPPELPLTAVIMAGGKGTRLRPLTENLPKPLVRVAGRPILEHLLLHLVGANVREIYLAINYLGHMVEDYFGDGSSFGCHIRYLREDQPLGTGGPLSLLPQPWPEDRYLLVMNGDLVTQVDVAAMLADHQEQANTLTMGVRQYEVAIPYGVVETDGNRLASVVEKPTYEYLVNAGIYVLSPRALTHVPTGEEFPITELTERCQAAGDPVGVSLVQGDWLDVGRPDELLRARGGG